MAIIVSGIKLPIDGTEAEACNIAIKKAKLHKTMVTSSTIVKRSVDARRGEVHFVYSVALETTGVAEQDIVAKLGENSIVFREKQTLEVPMGTKALAYPPVVVGFGPAGMFAALLLARKGYRPIVLERGGDVDSRVEAVEGFWSKGLLDVNCNVQYGEGGAGTFSDGKLTTRIGDPRASLVLEELVHFGATTDILYKAKPHIGTDKLRFVVKAIREEIKALGGEVRFDCPVTDLRTKDGLVTGVCTPEGEIETSCVIFAVGHSARDTFYMLKNNGVAITSKAFSVGARIEHTQEAVNRSLYGRHAEDPRLPVGEYQLSQRFGEKAAYTFCMCPGGTVVAAASEEGGVVVNGMSEYARNLSNANSAFVVSVDSDNFGNEWDSGILFQRKLEEKAFLFGGGRYAAPAQSVGNFLGKENISLGQAVSSSYPLGVKECALSEILPGDVVQRMQETLPIFARKLSCFGENRALLTGVETRTSSPVRIVRGEDMCSITLSGLYPCGEGAGYAGGIMSAAVDGIKIAQQIISEFSPFEIR